MERYSEYHLTVAGTQRDAEFKFDLEEEKIERKRDETVRVV